MTPSPPRSTTTLAYFGAPTNSSDMLVREQPRLEYGRVRTVQQPLLQYERRRTAEEPRLEYGRVTILQRPPSPLPLESNTRAPLPIAVLTLPTREVFEVGDETYDQCAICFEQWLTGDRVRCLPCGHYYHLPCIDQWLVNKPNCPQCRKDIL